MVNDLSPAGVIEDGTRVIVEGCSVELVLTIVSSVRDVSSTQGCIGLPRRPSWLFSRLFDKGYDFLKSELRGSHDFDTESLLSCALPQDLLALLPSTSVEVDPSDRILWPLISDEWSSVIGSAAVLPWLFLDFTHP